MLPEVDDIGMVEIDQQAGEGDVTRIPARPSSFLHPHIRDAAVAHGPRDTEEQNASIMDSKISLLIGHSILCLIIECGNDAIPLLGYVVSLPGLILNNPSQIFPFIYKNC